MPGTATVFQKPEPSIRSNWMVMDLLLNRMVIRSYQLLFALCRTTSFAVIVKHRSGRYSTGRSGSSNRR